MSALAVVLVVGVLLAAACGFLGVEWHSASDRLVRLEHLEHHDSNASAARLKRDEATAHAAALIVLKLQAEAEGLSARVSQVEAETGSTVVAPDGLSARLDDLSNRVGDLSTELSALRSCINAPSSIAQVHPFC